MTNSVCMLKLSFHLAILFCFSSGYAQVSGAQSVAGEYIIKMKSKPGVSSNGRLTAGMKLVTKVGPSIKIKQAFWGSEMMHIKVDAQSSVDTLKANPEVEFIEPNYLLSVNPVDIQPFGAAPSDSDYYDQSNSNVQVTDSWVIQKPYNQGSKVVVAIIDTGLDLTHGLFASSGALWKNSAEFNGAAGVDDDGNGYVDDIYGWNYVGANGSITDDEDHGTHVAGIVLGVGQDILATPVRESKIQIMPLKFLDGNGSGTTANAISAMYYAVNMGAKVINNSWGGSSYSRSLHEAYTYAYEHSVVVVSAAGNSASNNDSVAMYPSNIDSPNNISVAATTDSDNKASFSNYGSSVHVAAPGVSIISSVPGSGCLSPGCYQMMSGTSMAAPFVTGLAALIFREAPQLSSYQVKNIVLGSVDTYSTLSGKILTGGRVNVLKSIQAAKTQTDTAAYSPSYSPSYKSERAPAASSSEAPAAAGCGLIKAVIEGGRDGGAASGQATQVVIILVMVVMPFALALGLRNRQTALSNQQMGAQRRKFARYNLVKSMQVKIGNQIVEADTDTISLGGISFSGAIQAEKGEKITLQIGELNEEVEGEIVWCSQQNSYGVRFLKITEQLKSQVNIWTAGMTPT